MEFLTQLWLPILLSAVAVFFLSFLVWAVLPFHQNDFKKLPDEEAVTHLVKSGNIPPGNYAFPYAQGKACKDPEFKKRWMEGPTGTFSVWPKVSMGTNMALSFLVYFVVGLLIAYLAWTALAGRPAAELTVFRIAGTAGILAYSFAFLPGGIWFNHTRRALALNVLEGILYGLVTGLIFALLWPGA